MNEDALRKIRALLAKAEHPNTPPAEADTAMSMATTLMSKYAIDEAMVAERNRTGKVARHSFTTEAPYASQKQTLIAVIAKVCRLRAISVSRSTVVVFGFETDLEAAKTLYASLILQMSAAAAGAHPGRHCHGAEVVSFRKSFMLGWMSKVSDRLMEAHRAAEREAMAEHGSTMGLVLASNQSAVDAAFREAYPHTRQGKRASIGSAAGARAGSAAGATANIGGTSVGGGVRGAIGR